jgi:L-alanine-DL-glutamate epimerase-like enolase superfamily enzyme
LKIVKVEAIAYKIPYLRPLKFGTGTVSDVEHVLVRIHTDDCVIGQAEAPSRPYIYGESQASIVAAVRDWFAPSIIGLDIRSTERIHQRMQWIVANPTAHGAVNLAVWDAYGKTLGQPCCTLLGGFTDRLAVSGLIGFDTIDAMIGHAESMKSRYGINAFKLKTGRNVDEDIAMCRAVRKALPDADLYLDSNHAWTATDAIYAARATADLRFSFLEEPCPAEDRMGRRRLNQVLDIPVCGDESCTRLPDVAREVSDGISQMVSIKTARTGFTESRKIVGLCEGLSVPVVMGSQGDTMIGTLATLHFGAAFASTSKRAAELSHFLDISDDLLAEPLSIADGHIKVPHKSGLGIEVDEDKLRHYRTDSEQRC